MKKRIFLSPPHMDEYELQFIHEAFKSNYIAPLGPQVDAFEKEFSEYTGIKYCVALSSGTAAMHLALIELGVGPGDYVFGSTLTFMGSISPAIHLGANLVLIDCDRESWNMDPNLLAKELEQAQKENRPPKAVIPTDLYGQCSDYDRIYRICESYNVPVVVDAAEALGAYYFKNNSDNELHKIHAGKGATASIFSFNGNKIITTSGGGMLASDDKEIVEHAKFLSQQARDPYPYYEHSEIGFNYRMSNILAAIGRGQLKVINNRIKRKKEIQQFYYTHLKKIPGVEFMPQATYGEANCWLTCILITPELFGGTSEDVRLELEKENIESRPVWKPMHLQPVFKNLANKKKANESNNQFSFKVSGGTVSEDLFEKGLCLPSGTAMADKNLNRVITALYKCHEDYS